jgi:hypothetical protein
MRCAIALTKQHTIHNLGPKLGASLLAWHIGWKQKKKEKRLYEENILWENFQIQAIPHLG